MYTKKWLEWVTVFVLTLALLSAQAGVSARPVAAQGPLQPILWTEDVAEQVVFNQGYLTYSLVDHGPAMGTQLNQAIHWAWVVLGALPAKAIPVTTLAGQSMFCIMFRVVCPIVLAPMASFMQFSHTKFYVPAGWTWDSTQRMWRSPGGGALYDPATGQWKL